MRNSTKKDQVQSRRGRPREYDPDEALRAALGVFLKKGYGGTSLDALAEATGMNRPSLYAAFGDKKSIYRKALDSHVAMMRERFRTELFGGRTLAKDLRSFFHCLMDGYLGNEQGIPGVGCPSICTATAEAAEDPEIRADLNRTLSRLDSTFKRRFLQATQDGEELPGVPAQLALVAAAVMHSLAIRIRSGQSRKKAEDFIESSIIALTHS